MNKVDWERYEEELEEWRSDNFRGKTMLIVVAVLVGIFVAVVLATGIIHTVERFVDVPRYVR